MKKILSLFLAVMLAAGILGGIHVAAASSDISDWAVAEVNAASAAGLVPDSLMKDFKSPVTRGQVAEMFVRLVERSYNMKMPDILAAKGLSVNEGVFSDTTDINVIYANALGIINGTGQGKFSPDGTLKRAQIAAIINRAAKVVGIPTDGNTHEFSDITGNYSWADPELGWPVHAGVINGVGQGRFSPGGDLTTEQAIAITYRAYKALTSGFSYPDGISALFRWAMDIMTGYYVSLAEYHEANYKGDTAKATELAAEANSMALALDSALTAIDGYMMTDKEETLYMETSILNVSRLREAKIAFGGPAEGDTVREEFRKAMDDYVTLLTEYYAFFDAVRDGSDSTMQFTTYLAVFNEINTRFSNLLPETKAEADLNLETLAKLKGMVEEHRK